MREGILVAVLVILLAGCSTTNVASDLHLPAGASATVSVSAETVVVENRGEGTVEISPQGEGAESSRLLPRRTWRASEAGDIELTVTNSSSRPTRIRFALRGQVDGRTRLAIVNEDGGKAEVKVEEHD